jgi:DNA-binding IscR family transcriptional regulator
MRGICAQEAACTVRANWQTINHIVLQTLSRVTLEQMTKPLARPVPVASIKPPPASAPPA